MYGQGSEEDSGYYHEGVWECVRHANIERVNKKLLQLNLKKTMCNIQPKKQLIKE